MRVFCKNQYQRPVQVLHYPNAANAEPNWALSYLTYFPFPLSISWYRSQNLPYSGSIIVCTSFANCVRTSRSILYDLWRDTRSSKLPLKLLNFSLMASLSLELSPLTMAAESAAAAPPE